jgi:ribonuclease HII
MKSADFSDFLIRPILNGCQENHQYWSRLRNSIRFLRPERLARRSGSGNYGGMRLICGLDEAGRGPLAGPVTAGCAVLPPGFPIELLDDSKRLSPRARDRAFAAIVEGALDYSIGWAWPFEIDRINILRASLLAMKRAFEGLTIKPDFAIVDGNFFPDIAIDGEAKPRADAAYPPVMAASILAKVARDRWMTRWSWIEPEYGYERHKGYPTLAHRAALASLGPSSIQRMSFSVKQPEIPQ